MQALLLLLLLVWAAAGLPTPPSSYTSRLLRAVGAGPPNSTQGSSSSSSRCGGLTQRCCPACEDGVPQNGGLGAGHVGAPGRPAKYSMHADTVLAGLQNAAAMNAAAAAPATCLPAAPRRRVTAQPAPCSSACKHHR